MKIVAEPIDAVVRFKKKEKPEPVKFKYNENGIDIVIKVDKILEVEETRIAGIKAIVYRCQSEIAGVARRYELKYISDKCCWELFKI